MTDTHYDPLLDASWLAKDDMIIGWLRDTGRKFEPYTTPWMLDRIAEREGGSLEYVPANKASETVTAIRLDDVIDEPVALLKIDVEGHERAVLAGAERLIAASRPPMVLEANTGYHEQVLAAWLAEHDYTYMIADERNMLCLPRS
jgi:hypothetical protein